MEDTKDFMRHLLEVIMKLTLKIILLTRVLNMDGATLGHKTLEHLSCIAKGILGMQRSSRIILFDMNSTFELLGSIMKKVKYW